MFMLLSEQATDNPHGPYRRPGSGGHHLGDPWFRLSTLGYQQVQCSLGHSCQVLVSCYRHRANKFSKLINEGPLANLCHVSILPPSWRQNRYCLLYITGQAGPENMLQFGINGPGWAVSCQLRAGRAAKLLARAISNLNVACAGICVRIILLIVYLSESFLVQSKGSQTGVHVPPGVHFDYSRGTLCVT